MINNFFKTAFRHLWKTRGYSFLNIFGLAVGIAATSLIFLWVEDEVTRNDNFENKKDIYIVKSKQKYDDVTYVFAATQGPLAAAMKEELPGIKKIARLDWGDNLLFTVGDKSLYQAGYHADPELLDILSVEFLEGNRNSALAELNNIVLTEQTAERIFGEKQALGKSVRINNEESYIVSGIVKDFPKNSSYQFNWLIPFKKFEIGQEWLKSFGNNGVQTLVQLAPNTDLNKVNAPLYDLVERKTDGKTTFSKNFLYPMERWRLYDSFDKDGNEQEGFLKYVRLFSVIAWIVLFIACINFMNLATARSERRAKEVGMRKVVGANRKSLMGQFLGESIIYALLSALLAVGITHLSIGYFNEIVGKELSTNLFQLSHLLFLIAIVLICGLLAGIYPAFYLSSFNPLTTLKGAKQKAGAAGFIRRGLVILQYTAAIVLIICTSIIYQQIKHAKNRDLGFDRSQVITTSLQGSMSKHIDLIKEQLQASGNVESVGLADMSVLDISSNSSNFDWEGKDPNANILIGRLNTDADFVTSLGMKMHDGRNFRAQFSGDSSSFIINETFARMIQPDGLVAGQTLRVNDMPFTIVGVVKDFVYNNVFSKPEPVVFIPFNQSNGVVNIRTKAGVDLEKTLQQVESILKAHNPDYPFEYRFLDDTFDNKFRSEMLIQRLASVFATLSIIISCLGLFGLASFSAERRAKEIGIRKVLGASVGRLVAMLNREFVLLVALSCIIAFPIAWKIMQDWLASYNYRIEITWIVFALAAGIALLIAIFTISTQAFRAATATPTKTLRNE